MVENYYCGICDVRGPILEFDKHLRTAHNIDTWSENGKALLERDSLAAHERANKIKSN